MKSNYKLVKLILLWITVLVMIFGNTASLSASPATTARVEPSMATATRGGNFYVNITVHDIQNLFGLDVKLYWNATVLEVTDVDVRLGTTSHPDGVLCGDISPTDETNNDVGRYWLFATSIDSTTPSFNGSGNIVKLSFLVRNSGNTQLTLETKFADKPLPGNVAAEIASTTLNGIYSPVHISVSPSIITLGEEVNINGFTALPQANVNVTIQNRPKGSTLWNNLTTVKTHDDGQYEFTWQPDESGEYEIRASALLGDTDEVSYSVDLTVKEEPQTSVWQYLPFIVAVVIVVAVLATLLFRRNIVKRRKR